MTGPLTVTEWEALLYQAPDDIRALVYRLAVFHDAEFLVKFLRIQRAESDPMARFIAECCVSGEDTQVKARPLFECYRRWAEAGGEQPVVTETAFGRRLVEEGFVKEHTRSGSVYRGLGLLTEER